jgi:hypothetical protein
MIERRAYKRYKVDLFDITSAIIQASNIEIANISLNGIALHANRRLNIGEKYTLKIHSKEKTLSLKGIVIWSKISRIHNSFNGYTAPLYSAGLEFIDVTKSLRDDISIFIETDKIDEKIDNDTEDDTVTSYPKKFTRSFHRFRVNTPVEAFIIDQNQWLLVKDFSYGGLRIECTKPMKINSKLPMMLSFADDIFIIFQGRVISCILNKKASPRVYTIGIEFYEMSLKDRNLLAKHIRLLSDIDRSPSK